MQIHINMIGFIDVRKRLHLGSMDKDNFPNIVALFFMRYNYERLMNIYTVFNFITLIKNVSQ